MTDIPWFIWVGGAVLIGLAIRIIVLQISLDTLEHRDD